MSFLLADQFSDDTKTPNLYCGLKPDDDGIESSNAGNPAARAVDSNTTMAGNNP
jgi:hypothetical protein